jgi:RNA polymerase sigma-70 factor (ECF subfamily)
VEPSDRFESLYRTHAGAVRTFALRRAGSAEADDVVAEVFLSAWRRLDQVPTEPLPWLLGIARGALSNRRRTDDRHAALISRLMSEQLADSNRVAGEFDLAMVSALGSLSASDQELLLLVAWERLSSGQLAEMLGLSRGTVAVRLHRARRRLRRALAVEEQRTSGAPGRAPEMEVFDG